MQVEIFVEMFEMEIVDKMGRSGTRLDESMFNASIQSNGRVFANEPKNRALIEQTTFLIIFEVLDMY